METWNVLGYREYDFTAKDGKHISGVTLFLCRENRYVTGSECMKISVKPDVMNCAVHDIQVGSSVQLSYNRYGSVQSADFAF